MAGKDKNITEIPDIDTVSSELVRIKNGTKFRRTMNSTIAVLIVVAAIAILVATLWLPVLQIYGSSMTPLLDNGDIVVLYKTTEFDTGDIIAFYYNNKILVKRVIGSPGDWVSVEADGTVYVNEEKLDEPYVSELSLGECDIEFPYQVPDEAYFVMGDHRSVSIDSRSTVIGCVRHEMIVGRVMFRLWPVSRIEIIE